MSHQDRYEELRRELDADRFIQLAKEQAGLSDLGSNHFYEPLCKLLDCIAREVNLSTQGLAALKSDVNRILINRLRMQDDIKRYPEILDEDVSDPFIIIGLPRSGTTKLHKMLSAPDNVQKTLLWRLWNPARFPDAIPGKPDPRIAAAGTSHMLTEDNPIADAAHHMEEGEVEEEGFLYLSTFADWAWDQLFCVPSYFDWIMSRPSIETFRHVKTMLQYLQWQDGGRGGKHGGRPWVLKSVAYIANMDSLLECYPNATLINPHRGPHSSIPSFAKFLSGVSSIYVNKVDLHALGAETQRNWSVATDRYLETRDRLKLDDRILDVDYEQIRTDPMPIIRNIYQRAGRPLSAEAEQKMADWHNNNEQGRHGKHEYSLEEFGLSNASIDRAFDQYIKRFIDR